MTRKSWVHVRLFDDDGEWPDPDDLRLDFDSNQSVVGDISVDIDYGDVTYSFVGYPHQVTRIAVDILDRLSTVGSDSATIGSSDMKYPKFHGLVGLPPLDRAVIDTLRQYQAQVEAWDRESAERAYGE